MRVGGGDAECDVTETVAPRHLASGDRQEQVAVVLGVEGLDGAAHRGMDLLGQLAEVVDGLVRHHQGQRRVLALRDVLVASARGALQHLVIVMARATLRVPVTPDDLALPVHDRAQRVHHGKHRQPDGAELAEGAPCPEVSPSSPAKAAPPPQPALRPAPRRPSGNRPGRAAFTAAAPSSRSG